MHEESTAGLCARDATQFPQAIGLASSWDPDLVERIGGVIREQMVATGARHTLAPVLDVARDPRWGRVEETYGESAYLTGRLGVAYVRGVQGDLASGVAATGKHFLGYALSEGGLNHAPVQLGPRELREVFAEPFRAAIAEAGLATVMNSYASVDGLPCGGSKAILDDLLRGELGFTGAVVADYGTTGLLMTHHRVAATKGDAARRALEAGLDMELPQLDCYGAPLRELIERGEVDVALVDRSVRRVLALKNDLGLFERPFVDEDGAADAYARPADRALAREAAVKSLVLLRNEGGLLPVAHRRARRRDRRRGRRRTPAPGRLLVPRPHRDRADPRRATGASSSPRVTSHPGPTTPSRSRRSPASARSRRTSPTPRAPACAARAPTASRRPSPTRARRRSRSASSAAAPGSCPTAPAASSATSATSAFPACSSNSWKPSSRRARRRSWWW